MPSELPPFMIGADTWPGLAKLIEELAEAGQIAGKIIAYPSGAHPDGAGELTDRLLAELGDVDAAIGYLLEANRLDFRVLSERSYRKLALFRRWHREERQRAE